MLLTERHSGFTCGLKFPHVKSLSKSALWPLPNLSAVSHVGVWGWRCPSKPPHSSAEPHSGSRVWTQHFFFFFFFQELVAEARHRVLYSTVCFCIIESGDCLQPSNRTQLRGNMQIWWINISQWSEGEQQRDTGRTGSDRDRAMETFFMLRPLISQVHAYTVYVDI